MAEMVGYYHGLDGLKLEFEQAPAVGVTGKPAVLQSMGSQRFGHDCATELNWTKNEETLILIFTSFSE